MLRRALLASTLTLLIAAPPTRAAAPSKVDLIEHIFGASNVNAIAGNGGLTLGVSPVGDLSVLSWPSPSYTDQLVHVGSNALDVRQRRLMMADPGMGASVGIAWETPAGKGFSWLRDDPWVVRQGYGDPEAPIVETTFDNADLGLTVVLTDLVLPDSDVWARRVDLRAAATSPVTRVNVIHFSNLGPTLSRIPQLPLADWALDANNDFAALWDRGRAAIIHFHPADNGEQRTVTDILAPPPRRYGPIGDALTLGPLDESEAASLVGALDVNYGPGVYLALGADTALAGHQVGFDATPLCEVTGELIDNLTALSTVFPDVTLPLDPAIATVLRCQVTLADIVAAEGVAAPTEDARADAADGALSGGSGAIGRVNEALAVALDVSPGAEVGATFYLAAADTAASAFATLDTARATPWAEHRARVVTESRAWLSRAHLPTKGSERLRALCKRVLLNLRVGTDRESGAIVASISRQAPYGLDWPRDGAFFDAALDVAGYPEMVEAHGRFYLRTLRRAGVAAEPIINADPPPDPDDPGATTFPAGAWEMNYYADGLVGGNIRFEIDNTGLAVWGLVDHARYLEDDGARAAWLAEIWPTVREAAELLVRWRDPATGLQAPANEDDNLAYTQTLHGAISTWLGIDQATRAAEATGHSDEATRWGARRDELRAAILEHFFDPAAGLFVEALDAQANPGNAPGGATSWLVWPAMFLPWEDARVQAQLRANLAFAQATLDPKNGGGAYVTKILVPGALALTDPADRAIIEEALNTMVDRASTPDTLVFGETFVAVDGDGDGALDAFSARVSNPHLWAGTLVYLTAMSLEAPARITDPLAPAQKSGGGCAGAGTEPAPGLLAACLLALWLGRRRRAQPGLVRSRRSSFSSLS